ncbi:uncharacterized protein [Diadema antillarum]|uniref:uncharacterized protein n=1 Tax=Diadema antillarum TaxID=105358 RepID=UPI003A8BD2FE
MEVAEQSQSKEIKGVTSVNTPKARVLATAVLEMKEVIKKPLMAATMAEVEKELKEACVVISNLSVDRVLVYDKFFEEYVDEPNHVLVDKDKIILHFASATMPSTTAAPSYVKPSTSQSTLVIAKDGTLKISSEPPLVQESSQSDCGQLSERDIEERAKIFGRDGKHVNRYGKRINAVALSLAKEDPSLLQNRGNLLQKARLALHESGYEYAHGKKTRSKKFGTERHKAKEVSNHSREVVRQDRLNELTEIISSLRRQVSYLEKGKEQAVNSNLFCKAATLDQQVSEMNLKIRKLHMEKTEIQRHSAKLEKRRSRKRNRSGRKEARRQSKEIQSAHVDSSTDVDSSVDFISVDDQNGSVQSSKTESVRECLGEDRSIGSGPSERKEAAKQSRKRQRADVDSSDDENCSISSSEEEFMGKDGNVECGQPERKRAEMQSKETRSADVDSSSENGSVKSSAREFMGEDGNDDSGPSERKEDKKWHKETQSVDIDSSCDENGSTLSEKVFFGEDDSMESGPSVQFFCKDDSSGNSPTSAIEYEPGRVIMEVANESGTKCTFVTADSFDASGPEEILNVIAASLSSPVTREEDNQEEEHFH